MTTNDGLAMPAVTSCSALSPSAPEPPAMRNTLIAAAVATVRCSLSFGAHADTTGNIFKDGHVDGELRLYNFDRIYSTSAVPDAHALSGAVLLNAQTAEFGGGFSLGGSLVSANAFGQQA